MKRFLIAATLAAALAGCTAGPAEPRYAGRLKPVANPSAVIAAELAFARLAQEKGQWAAFRATAAKDAEMFVPQRVKAADWLKGRAEPAVAVQWQPHAVWSSCDGSYAVTHGNWQSANASGTFATVWQRQQNGGYKWVSDMSLASSPLEPDPEMVAASVADCPKRDERPTLTGTIQSPGEGDIGGGSADDRTLRWKSVISPDGSRRLTVSFWKDGNWRDVLTESSGQGR